MAERRVFRVIFHNRDQIYELYAKKVAQGELFGFIEIEEILFGERTQVVVDPAEESLKTEFQGVKRFQVPMQAVIRVDEVTKEGVSRISSTGGEAKGEGTLSRFPSTIFTPENAPKK